MTRSAKNKKMTTQDHLQAVARRLQAKAWFRKGKWLSSVHGFPAENPAFITFHIFKKSYVTLHLLHQDLIPGTSVKRVVFAKRVVDAVFNEVRTWPGYKFRAGKYGQQPFAKVLEGSSADFEETLENEVERLCLRIEPIIDEALKELLVKKGQA